MRESNRLLIPPAELLNRGGQPLRRGRIVFWSAEYRFSVMRSLEIIVAAKCPDVVLQKSTFFVIFQLSLSLNADCNFERKVLKIMYSILFTVAEVVSRTILYHFKKINWIGTHWRETQRRSPVEGVNSVINFCL